MKIILAIALWILTAKANPFDDVKVEEEEKMLQPEGSVFQKGCSDLCCLLLAHALKGGHYSSRIAERSESVDQKSHSDVCCLLLVNALKGVNFTPTIEKEPKVNCVWEWGSWSAYGSCNSSTGKRSRSRPCTCSGPSSELKTCKALENAGQKCWNHCHGTQGKCSWCGLDGYCCRKGWFPGNECDGSFGGHGDHVCVLKPTD